MELIRKINTQNKLRLAEKKPFARTTLSKIMTIAFAVALVPTGLMAAQGVSITVHPDRPIGRVDERVYGHFLEHIYHSVNGGLWGEMVWGRSFEEPPYPPDCKPFVQGDKIVHLNRDEGVHTTTFGNPGWSNYVYSFEVQRLPHGQGELIIPIRSTGPEQSYALNIGCWTLWRANLEKAAHGDRRFVSDFIPAGLETGRWHEIRIRCDGARIQAWLDQRKVVDFTDQDRPLLTGCVGLGSGRMAVEYRNLKVTTLDGQTLFQGLPADLPRVEPPGPEDPVVGESWEAYGNGRFRLVDGALNSDRCQSIESRGSEAGVRQSPLAVTQGEVYHGSLWACGKAEGGLVVRLVAGEQVLAEAKLPIPGEKWREYPFKLRPVATAVRATLQVGVVSKGKVCLDQVSLMSESARRAGGFRPDLLQAAADLHPAVVRWPGGGFASFYRWKYGIGPQSGRRVMPAYLWNDLDVNAFGTDEFVDFCRRVGAEPVIVINVGSTEDPACRGDYLREALEWLEYCNGPADSRWGRVRASNGHPAPYHVKYWEIDNEKSGWGESYVPLVKEFSAALRRADPAIKIIVNGSLGIIKPEGNSGFNKMMVDACSTDMDFLSIHWYEDAHRFAEGPADFERFVDEKIKLIEDSANPGIKIFWSEWNGGNTEWRSALYTGGILNSFERYSQRVAMASPALFFRHVRGQGWDNAFINFDQQSWFPAPHYVVMKLWRDRFAPVRVDLEGEAGPLNVIATRTDNGQAVILKAVNPADAPVTVRLDVQGNYTPAAAEMTLIAPGDLNARNTLERPQAVHPEPGRVELEDRTLRFTLPRWSVAVVTMRSE